MIVHLDTHVVVWLYAGAVERLSPRARADLGTAESTFARVTACAVGLTWTRDPFDRLICAHALCDDAPLLTADRRILEQCAVAEWEG